MVTPFDDAGALNLTAAADLATWLVDNGSDGLVIAGTTGESPTLSSSEEYALAKAVREAVSVPLLLGTGSNDTSFAMESTKKAASLGMDGVLVVGPYYNRPSQAGLDAYFRSVASATELPVMIYDIPHRTGRKIVSSTLLRLAHEVPNIVALKDAAGDPAETARLMRDMPEDFEVYCGDDSLTLPLFAVGAVGIVSVASHWAGRQLSNMIRTFLAGDLQGAIAMNRALIESYDFEGGDESPNPQPSKAMLRELGMQVGPCRPPMTPDPEWLAARALEVLRGLPG